MKVIKRIKIDLFFFLVCIPSLHSLAVEVTNQLETEKWGKVRAKLEEDTPLGKQKIAHNVVSD